MHITDCKDMDNFFSTRAPNTTLGLSLNMSTESPPSTSLLQITPTQTFGASAPLMNFLPPFNLSNRFEDVYAGARPSHPPVPLELLPLQPSSHRLSLSSSPRPKLSLSSSLSSPITCQPAPFSASSCTAPSMSSVLSRGIDMNQRPASADHDEIVYMSPGLRVRMSESSLLLMKRERERSSDTEQERLTCEVSSRGSDEEGEGGGSARKKLRLSKEQSTLLEESFKEHSTLNPKQKAELAKQLNLRPRQVEVWFQNRRARTKLKQTEVDCELLKRCCESLTEENRRLQKEVAELRAIKVAPPCVISPDLFMPLPAATLSICPSCQRLASHGTAAPSPPPASLLPSFSRSPPAPSSHHHHHQLPLSFPQPPPPRQHVMPSAAC